MFAALFTTVFFSLSAVTANRSVRYMGGNEANFWRLAIATFLLGIFAYVWGIGLEGSFLPWFVLSGLVGFGLGDVALFQAYPKLGSRLTVLIVHCLAAPIAMTAEWLWLGNAVSLIEIISCATILAGIVLALAPGKQAQRIHRQWFSGIVLAIIAALGQGGGAVISRKAYSVAEATADTSGINLDGFTGGLTATFQRILAGLVIAGISVLFVKRRAVFAHFGRLTNKPMPVVTKNQWGKAGPWIMVNALMGPTLGVACLQWALQSTESGIVLPIVALTPLVVVPFSTYMEGEKPPLRSLIGGIVAVIGVVLLTQSGWLEAWLNR
jgi:drug/metabolite transporter (DMT)-like permease